ncbi:unnamed protein product [Urochloa humidicola]
MVIGEGSMDCEDRNRSAKTVASVTAERLAGGDGGVVGRGDDGRFEADAAVSRAGPMATVTAARRLAKDSCLLLPDPGTGGSPGSPTPAPRVGVPVLRGRK